MKIIHCKTYEDMSLAAAKIVEEEVAKKKNAVLGFATGSTPEGLYAQLAADKFARERLGWWSPTKLVEHPIDPTAWERCRSDFVPEGVICYGVKFSADSSTVSLSVAVKPDRGPAFIECVANRSMASGIAWLVDWLAERRDRPAQIVVDGKSGAQTLVERLLDRGVPSKALIVPSARDIIAAVAALYMAVTEGTVTHAGQPAMTASATETVRRKIGNDGGWGFASTDRGDATLIESAALAYWATQTTKRKPGRKAVVI